MSRTKGTDYSTRSKRSSVRTVEAIEQVQIALKHGTEAQKIAAESLLSYLVLTLKYDQSVLPAALEPHYDLIQEI
jgi:hypothetical protein